MTPTPDGGEIVLFVPADAASGVNYTLNGQPFSMQPGQLQKLVNDRVWTIEFAPTAGQIALRYTLVSARFKFKPSGTGIGLFQTQDLPSSKISRTGDTPNSTSADRLIDCAVGRICNPSGVTRLPDGIGIPPRSSQAGWHCLP